MHSTLYHNLSAVENYTCLTTKCEFRQLSSAPSSIQVIKIGYGQHLEAAE